MTGILYILRGQPGSGKTTLAKTLAGENSVSADDFMVDELGQYRFDSTRLLDCHARCAARVRELLSSQPVVAVANVFAQWRHVYDYIRVAKEMGCQAFVLECQNDFDSEHFPPGERARFFLMENPPKGYRK